MENSYKVIHQLIERDSWKVREVYTELLKGLYNEKEIQLPDGPDYLRPYEYLDALYELIHLSGDLTVVQIERLKQISALLIDNECEYYVRLIRDINLSDFDEEYELPKAILLRGGDIYHTMAHNCMVASYLLLLRIINPERYNLTGTKLEIAILTALFHDSVQSSDAQKEMATWNESAVVAVLDQVYNANTRKMILKEVLEMVRYTDYSDPECPFYVDFSVGSSNLKIEWGAIPIMAQMIVISDWLGQTVFVDRRSRNIMVNYLYQYWLVQTGNDKTHEFPMKVSIFRAVIECLLQMPELFLIDDNMVEDLRDELIYFHDSKTNIAQCFSSKKELYSMGIVDALRLMHSYLSK